MNTRDISLFLLLTTLTLPGGNRAACGDGTLACHTSGDSADTPILCDITSHYMLSDDKKTCEQKKVDGCEVAAYDDSTQPCLLCEPGMVFDSEKKKCVAVAAGKKVELCQRYNANDSTCSLCNQENYLSNAEGKCIPVITKIENCNLYSGKDFCDSCKPNFYLKDKKCITVPEVENCQITSNRVCDTCASDYMMDRGWLHLPIVNGPLIGSFQSGLLTNRSIASANLQSVCRKKISTNCLTFENYKECKVCAAQYFINDSKACERYPEPSILNCAKYSDNVTCIQCKVNFFVTGTPTKCEAIKAVDGCKTYKITENKCKECNDTHFLDPAANTCTERTKKSIDNCKSLNPEADACLTCNDNFTKTTPAAHKCLADAPSCKPSGLINGTDTGTKHTCSECTDDTFYIDSDALCKTRNVNLCKQYISTTNTCIICQDGHYLQSPKCMPQSVQFCSKFTSNVNRCDDCNTGYEKVDSTTCKKNEVPGCLTYEKNTKKCKSCNPGMFVDSDICKTPSVANCQIHEPLQQKCKFCEAGFYLHTDFTCLEQKLPSCVVHTTNKNECESCSFGYKLSGTTCTAWTADNCSTYHATLDQCASCARGYYMVGTTCTPLPTNTFCLDFNSNSTVCKTCEAGKYLDTADNNLCKALPENGCVEFTLSTKTCTKCSVKHYASNADPNIPCIPRDKDNCKTYSGDTNNCSACGPGYFQSGGSCSKGTQNNCAVFSTTEDKCTNCIQSYFPNSGTGVCEAVSTIAKCITYKTNENKCEECESGYFTANGSACTLKNITDCKSYTTDKDAQTCALCDKIKKLKVSSDATQCQALTNSSNCVTSTGDAQDKCESCKLTQFLETGVCSGTNTPNEFDGWCKAHEGTSTATNKCSICEDGYTLVENKTGLQAKTQAQMDLLNCLKLSSDGNCKQCKDWYKLETNFTCTQFTGDKWTAMCKRKKDGVTTALTTGTGCEICSNPASCWNDNGTCTSRGFHSVLEGCDEFLTTGPKCKSCDVGKYSQNSNYTFLCANDSNLNDTGSEDHCQVYYSKNKCYSCDQGYILKSDGSFTCEAIASDHKVERSYTFKMTPSKSIKKTSNSVTNCAKYAQKDETDIECVKCKTGFVGIVTFDPTRTTDDNKILTVFSNDNYSGKLDFVNTFSKCVDDANAYKIGVTTHVSEGDCLIGHQSGNALTGYACLRCIDTKIGKLDTVTHSEGDVALTASLRAVKSCTNIVITSDYPGRLNHFMAMNLPWGNIALNPNVQLPFDSCVDKDTPANLSSTQVLLYPFLQNDSFGHLSFSSQKNTNSTPFDGAYCVPRANVKAVSFCSFYFLKSEPGTSYDILTEDLNLHTVCGGCQPGSIPNFTSSKHDITSCDNVNSQYISTEPNSQNWMNTVQTPKYGSFKLDNSAPLALPDFKTFIENNQGKENCYYVDPNNNFACLYCKPGFSPYKGECVMSIGGADECKYINGRIDVKLETADPKKQIQQFQQLIIQRLLYSGIHYVSNTSEICSSCTGDKSPRIINTLFYTYCTEKTRPSDVPTDCDQTEPDDHTKCVKCASNKTLRTDTKVCITKIANCVESSDASTCTTCETGYRWFSTACQQHFCKEWDSADTSVCLLCNDNKSLVENNTGKCSNVTQANCTNYSPKYQACVNSATQNKIIPVIKIQNNDETYYREMISQREMNQFNSGYKKLNADYTFIQQEGNPQTGVVTSPEFKIVMTSEFTNRSYSKTPGVSPTSAFCLLQSNTFSSQCKNSVGFACQECNSLYRFSETMNDCALLTGDHSECVSGYFKKDASEIVCTKCTDGFYVSGSSAPVNYSCKTYPRTNSGPSNCKVSKTDKDECESCNPGKYLDTTDSNKCNTNTASNCAVKSTTANVCETCTAKHFKKSDGNCDTFTAKNCETLIAGQDKCDKCLLGHVKNGGGACVISSINNCLTWRAADGKCASCSSLSHLGASTGLCTAKTAKLCNAFHASDDKCQSCSADFIIGAKDCTAKTRKFCTAFHATLDQCVSCTSVAKSNLGVCERRVANNCKTFVTTNADQCETCTDLTFKNGTSCSKPTEKHCRVTKGTTDQCQTCLSAWTANASFACEKDPSNTCLTNNQNNSDCLSCPQGKYLNGTACAVNNAENCADGKKSTTENKCSECATNFWLDTSDGNKCKSNSADNCTEKSKTKNECVSCLAKFYLDASDSNKCKQNTAQNCATWHTTSLECLTCADKMLEGSSGGKKTCSVYQTQDCLKHSSAKDECETCTNATHFRENKTSKFVCTARKVTNCKDFKTDQDKCTECNQQTYLKDGKCEQNVTVKDCKTYSIVADLCALCNDRYYKSGSKNECWLYPDGIEGCVAYSNRTTCSKCNNKSFLSSDKCETVTTEVPDCKEYSSATDCLACVSGKMLLENKCETISATNCLEYTNKDTCSTCADPFVMNTTNSKCESSGISDCDSATYSTDGNTCQKCKAGKVLSDDKKKCNSSTTTIANCHDYETNNKCKACKPGFIRNLDSSKCDAIGSSAGANCSVASTLVDSICDVCRLGYSKDSQGKCIISKLEACLVPTEDLTKCQLCGPNSYMDKDAKCIVSKDSATPSRPDSAYSSSISSALMFVVLWML